MKLFVKREVEEPTAVAEERGRAVWWCDTGAGIGSI